MNHAGIVQFESERVYNLRRALYDPLDDTHFEALNPDGHVISLWGYCLDAIEELPAGCMVSGGKYPSSKPIQHHVTRAVSHQEQRELDEAESELIAEILAGLAKKE